MLVDDLLADFLNHHHRKILDECYEREREFLGESTNRSHAGRVDSGREALQREDVQLCVSAVERPAGELCDEGGGEV